MQAKISIGMRVGRLVVVSIAEPRRISGKLRKYWLCKCLCGVSKEIIERSLIVGDAVSCGCYSRERAKTLNQPRHGQATRRTGVSPEYRAWAKLKERCFNKNVKQWNDYGGRGISVCTEWRESFESFYRHVGRRPSNKHSIDRINNNGDYEPGNVRWATKVEQRRNRRDAWRLK